ncbi:hypothetical protein O1L68_06215 [Streptomyces lydicus]|nr:hypothetical protein [Streptomyces lydicus]
MPIAGPVGCAVTHALGEPDEVRARTAAAARLYGMLAAALHHTVTEAGALCRPPHSGSHLYADLEPLRRPMAARGTVESRALERKLAPWGRAADTASGTRRAPCGYASAPRHCSAPTWSCGNASWPRRTRWNSRTSPGR